MPLEYIDEEMCSLAILNALDWSDYAWFYSTYERKPEALTADLWKLGARLYETDENKILDITPEEYKDVEYYKERCCTNYNCGSEIASWKDKIMDSIPQEILTPEFLLDLLVDSLENIAMFNEKALETKISYSDTSSGEIVTETIWQFIVKLNGNLILVMNIIMLLKRNIKRIKRRKKILKLMQSKWQEQEIIIEVLPKKQCQGFMLMC